MAKLNGEAQWHDVFIRTHYLDTRLDEPQTHPPRAENGGRLEYQEPVGPGDWTIKHEHRVVSRPFTSRLY